MSFHRGQTYNFSDLTTGAGAAGEYTDYIRLEGVDALWVEIIGVAGTVDDNSGALAQIYYTLADNAKTPYNNAALTTTNFFSTLPTATGGNCAWTEAVAGGIVIFMSNSSLKGIPVPYAAFSFDSTSAVQVNVTITCLHAHDEGDTR